MTSGCNCLTDEFDRSSCPQLSRNKGQRVGISAVLAATTAGETDGVIEEKNQRLP